MANHASAILRTSSGFQSSAGEGSETCHRHGILARQTDSRKPGNPTFPTLIQLPKPPSPPEAPKLQASARSIASSSNMLCRSVETLSGTFGPKRI